MSSMFRRLNEDNRNYFYYLRFNASGGTGAPDTESVVSNLTSVQIEIPSNIPTRTNYTFLGWSFNEGSSTAQYHQGDFVTLYSTNADRTMYAVWQYNPRYTYTLNFSANGGSGAPGSESFGPTTATSWTFEIPTTIPTRTDYTFIGWSFNQSATTKQYDPGDNVILYSSQTTRTLYAVWQAQTRYNYILYFNANGGTGGPSTEESGSTTATSWTFEIPFTQPTRDGYNFKGWSLSYSATTPSYYPGDNFYIYSYLPTRTLYAVWEQIPTYTYVLNFNANGGTGGPDSETFGPTTATSWTFEIPSGRPSKVSFEFLGWATTSSAITPQYVAGDYYTLTSSQYTKTLYAVYAPVGFVERTSWVYPTNITTSLFYIGTNNGGYNSYNGQYNPITTPEIIGNCTWYANGRTKELANLPLISEFPNLGRATNWFSNASSLGSTWIKEGFATPTEELSPIFVNILPGDILCWYGVPGGGYEDGHVEIVEKVEGDIIYVSKSDYGSSAFSRTTHTLLHIYSPYHSNTNLRFQGVIHNPYVQTPTSQYTITTEAIPTLGGTISGGGTYPVNTLITLTATANSGYIFDSWTDGITTATRREYVFTDKTYKAQFTEQSGDNEFSSILENVLMKRRKNQRRILYIH